MEQKKILGNIFNILEVCGHQRSSKYLILHVHQNKNAGLKQLEGESVFFFFFFLGELFLKYNYFHFFLALTYISEYISIWHDSFSSPFVNQHTQKSCIIRFYFRASFSSMTTRTVFKLFSLYLTITKT